MKTNHNKFGWRVAGSLASAICLVLLGLALLFAMSGCGVSRKAKTTEYSKVDSTRQVTIDSSAYSITNETTATKKDSTGEKTEEGHESYWKEESTHTEIYMQGDTATINVVFGKDSTTRYEDKDKIITLQQKDGVLIGQFINKPKIIPANGYKKEGGTKAIKKTDNSTTGTTENKSASAQKAEQVKKVDSGAVVGERKVVTKKKDAIQLPWYAYLIGGVLLILLAYWLYRRYRNRLTKMVY